MKRFTKISLIAAAVLTVLGIVGVGVVSCLERSQVSLHRISMFPPLLLPGSGNMTETTPAAILLSALMIPLSASWNWM